MKKLFVSTFLCIFLFGCSAQLQTLISLSSEQNAQHSYVARQKKLFQSLLKHIERKKLKLGVSSNYIIGKYGEPIAIKKDNNNKIFVYRDPVEFFPEEKAYLVFDEKDALISFELVKEELESKPTE